MFATLTSTTSIGSFHIGLAQCFYPGLQGFCAVRCLKALWTASPVPQLLYCPALLRNSLCAYSHSLQGTSTSEHSLYTCLCLHKNDVGLCGKL